MNLMTQTRNNNHTMMMFALFAFTSVIDRSTFPEDEPFTDRVVALRFELQKAEQELEMLKIKNHYELSLKQRERAHAFNKLDKLQSSVSTYEQLIQSKNEELLSFQKSNKPYPTSDLIVVPTLD